MKDIIKLVENFSKLKILVVGDIMLDRFIWGDVERISPEAPVPIVKVTKENYILGGAANVLNNIVSLSASADICGIVGDDLFGGYILDMLRKKRVNQEGVVIEKNFSTIVKTRVIGHKQQIVRVDREDSNKVNKKIYNKLLNFIRNNISKYDAVILSDYGKGVVSKPFYKELVKIAKDNKKILNIDPKQVNMTIYKNPTLLTPNLTEASFAANRRITLSNLNSAGKKLLKKFQSDYLVITLGEHGMAIFDKTKENYTHIPTVAREVYDVTGAGDTVISVLTLGMALGENVVDSAKVANLVAGIVVGKVGTATVTPEELLNQFS